MRFSFQDMLVHLLHWKNVKSGSPTATENKKMFQLYGMQLKLARTAVHYMMYLILGLMMSIPGPTLIDLKHIIGTDSKHISFIYTARSTGFLFGSLSAGFILDFMKNEQIALLISGLFVSLGAFTIPWCRSLIFLLATFGVTGFATGFSNTGHNASCLGIWGKKSAPFLQGLHFAYGIGGFLGPLLAAPFLSSQVDSATSLTDESLLGVAQNITADLLNEVQNVTSQNLSIIRNEITSIPSVTIAYSILGISAALVCGCFLIVCLLSSDEKSKVENDEQANIRDPGLPFTIIVVILACLQTGIISGVEISFAQMLTSYVVKSAHNLSKSTGSYMTSLYWGAFTVTRGASILLACKISVKYLLAFDIIVSTAAGVILLTMATWSVHALWVGTSLLGIGVASIFPATLSWVEKYININNRIASVFTLVSSLLEMTVPLLISVYLESQPNVLFQFITAATLTVCFIFTVLNIILNRKGQKYVKEESQEIEKEPKKEEMTAV